MKSNVYREDRVPAIPVPTKKSFGAWLIPLALIVLSVIPLIGGAIRLIQLASGAQITAENARFFASPLPVIVHIVSVSVYAIFGALQFVPSLRQRRNRWHRIAGWVLIPCGLAVALSGLWMTLFYPWPKGDGAVLYGLRLLFGSAMLLFVLLGIAAIQRRDFVRHGDWMLRGYAVGMGAVTQVVTLMIEAMIVSQTSELSRAVAMGAAWVINLAVAEWIIRKPLTKAHFVRSVPTAI